MEHNGYTVLGCDESITRSENTAEQLQLIQSNKNSSEKTAVNIDWVTIPWALYF